MRDDVQRRKLNLMQLRKNKRNRPDKTSGRKRPRTADVDVIAAPTRIRQSQVPLQDTSTTTWNQTMIPTTRSSSEMISATHATVLILLLAKTERSTR